MAGHHAQGDEGNDAHPVPHDGVLPGQPFRGQEDLRGGQVESRAGTKKIGRHEADELFKAIQQTKITAPATDCISPIGEELLLKGLRHLVPGEFYAAATRPPAVYRGNPFAIEVAWPMAARRPRIACPKETLVDLLSQTDARTLRQFLATTFDGLRRRGGGQDRPSGQARSGE